MSMYEPGDFVKVELPDEATGIGEWVWVRVLNCDDKEGLVFGVLDNQPINDYAGKLRLGTQLAISFSQIREHKRSVDFESKN